MALQNKPRPASKPQMTNCEVVKIFGTNCMWFTLQNWWFFSKHTSGGRLVHQFRSTSQQVVKPTFPNGTLPSKWRRVACQTCHRNVYPLFWTVRMVTFHWGTVCNVGFSLGVSKDLGQVFEYVWYPLNFGIEMWKLLFWLCPDFGEWLKVYCFTIELCIQAVCQQLPCPQWTSGENPSGVAMALRLGSMPLPRRFSLVGKIFPACERNHILTMTNDLKQNLVQALNRSIWTAYHWNVSHRVNHIGAVCKSGDHLDWNLIRSLTFSTTPIHLLEVTWLWY